MHGPQTEISLIAHSMGGLVSRYYLESSVFRNRGLPLREKRLVTLGTPHRARRSPCRWFWENNGACSSAGPKCCSALRYPRYPSSYQLLPAPASRSSGMPPMVASLSRWISTIRSRAWPKPGVDRRKSRSHAGGFMPCWTRRSVRPASDIFYRRLAESDRHASDDRRRGEPR